MGLEVSEEFWPITPVRTVSAPRVCNHSVKFSDPTQTKEPHLDVDEECHTPKSEAHTLKTPLVCPPPPKKPRPARRKSRPPHQGFLQVPEDLASIFLALSQQPSKKIRAH